MSGGERARADSLRVRAAHLLSYEVVCLWWETTKRFMRRGSWWVQKKGEKEEKEEGTRRIRISEQGEENKENKERRAAGRPWVW